MKKLTVEEIAEVIHEANRAYCKVLGDETWQVPWSDAPDWQKNTCVAGVKSVLSRMVTGEDYKPSDSHDSWMKTKECEGWKYGQVKDPKKKEHPCMVPYDDLPEEQKIKDIMFIAIAKTLS